MTAEVHCRFGENQIMETADVVVTEKTESGNHRFTYQIENGALVTDGWIQNYDSISRDCELHPDCNTNLLFYRNWEYRNPYFWNRVYSGDDHSMVSDEQE